MITTQTIQQSPLFNISTGLALGRVNHVYLDTNLEQIAFLEAYASKDAYASFDEMSHHISGPAIRCITKQGVFVHSHEGELSNTAAVQGTSAESLYGRRVLSTNYLPLGQISNVILNIHGKVLGFWLNPIFVQGIFTRSPFISRRAVRLLGDNYSAMHIDLNRNEADSLSLNTTARYALS